MKDQDRPEAARRGLSLVLAVEDEAWQAVSPGAGMDRIEALAERAAAATFRHVKIPETTQTEISIILTGDAAIRGLNAQWRGKDAATNVLSFPMSELEPGDVPGLLLGDLVLAHGTIEREAAVEGKSFDDHLCHLIVHGILHCLGFDHVEDDDAKEMETLEIAILADLSIDDPYAGSLSEHNSALRSDRPAVDERTDPQTQDAETLKFRRHPAKSEEIGPLR